MNHGAWPGLVLLAYIPVIWFFFARFSAVKAAAMSLLGATLFLPEDAAFDLPVLPPFDKHSIPAIVATIALMRQLPKRALAPPVRFLMVLGALNVLGAVGTLLTNRETHVVGVMNRVVLPGLQLYDFPGLFTDHFVYYYLPFFVGAVTITSLDSARVALRLLVKAGLLLSLFCLFEVRMSPNLHTWIYGYSPHPDFSQAVRWGGYRPSVFFYHGLVAAFFMMLTTLAAGTCVRARIGMGMLGRMTLPYLMVVLILCKSTGAIITAVAFLPLLLLLQPRTQLAICVVVCAVVMTFPYTRTVGLFPTQALVDWASSISPDRAASLLFRFTNEDAVLEKMYAFEKVWFGWGGFARSHVFESWTGTDTTVTDGQWLVLTSSRGVVGLFTIVSLLVWPVWRAWRSRWRLGSRTEALAVGGLAILVSVGALEMLPNDPQVGVHYWLAGGLYGLTHGLVRRRWG